MAEYVTIAQCPSRAMEKDLVDLFVSAFSDDPMMDFLANTQGDTTKLRRYLETIFDIETAGLQKYGSTFSIYDPSSKETVAGVSLIHSDRVAERDEDMTSWANVGRVLGMYAKNRYMWPRFRTMMVAVKWMERLHHDTMGDRPHLYLVSLGVSVDRRGEGLGGRMLQVVKDMADRMGLPIYIENCKTDNLHFYKKHGFELTPNGEVKTAGHPDGPPVYIMVREPKQCQ